MAMKNSAEIRKLSASMITAVIAVASWTIHPPTLNAPVSTTDSLAAILLFASTRLSRPSTVGRYAADETSKNVLNAPFTKTTT